MKMLLPVRSLPPRAVSSRATTTTTEYEPDQSQVTTVRESKLACEAPETALAERKTDPGLLAKQHTTPSDQAIRGQESAREAETGFEYTPNAYALHFPPLRTARSAIPERAMPNSDHGSEASRQASVQLKNAIASAPSAAPTATSPLSNARTIMEKAPADSPDLALTPGCAIAFDHLPASKAENPLLPGTTKPFGQFLTADAPADDRTKFSLPHSSCVGGVGPMPERRRATATFDRSDTDTCPPVGGAPHFTGIAGPFDDILRAGAPADGQTEFSFPNFPDAVGMGPISEPRLSAVAFGQIDTDPSDKSAFDPDRPPVTAGSLYDIPRAGAPADDGTRSSFPKFGNAVDMGMISEPRGSAAAFGRNDPDRPRNDPDRPVYPSYTGNLGPVGGHPSLVVTDFRTQTPLQQQDAMDVAAWDAPDVPLVGRYMEVTPGSHPAHTSISSSDPSGGWGPQGCLTLMEAPPDWHSEASSSSTATGGNALAPRTELPGQGAGESVTGVESGAAAPGPPAHMEAPPDWHSEASSSSTATGGNALAPRTELPGQGAGEGVTGVESGATAPGPPAHMEAPYHAGGASSTSASMAYPGLLTSSLGVSSSRGGIQTAHISDLALGAGPIGRGVIASALSPGHPGYTGNLGSTGDHPKAATGFSFAPEATALHPVASAHPPSPLAPPGPSSPPPPTFGDLFDHLFEACNSGYPSTAPVRQCVMVVSESSSTSKGAPTAWVQVHAGQPRFGKLSPTDGTLPGWGLHSSDQLLAVTQDSSTHPLFSRCDVTAEYAAQLAWQHDPRRVNLPDGSQVDVRIVVVPSGGWCKLRDAPADAEVSLPSMLTHLHRQGASELAGAVRDAYRFHLNPSAPPASPSLLDDVPSESLSELAWGSDDIRPISYSNERVTGSYSICDLLTSAASRAAAAVVSSVKTALPILLATAASVAVPALANYTVAPPLLVSPPCSPPSHATFQALPPAAPAPDRVNAYVWCSTKCQAVLVLTNVEAAALLRIPDSEDSGYPGIPLLRKVKPSTPDAVLAVCRSLLHPVTQHRLVPAKLASRCPRGWMVDLPQGRTTIRPGENLPGATTADLLFPAPPPHVSRKGRPPPGGRASQVCAPDGLVPYTGSLLDGSNTFLRALRTLIVTVDDSSYPGDFPALREDDHGGYSLDTSAAKVHSAESVLRRANVSPDHFTNEYESRDAACIAAAWILQYLATPSPVKHGRLRRGCFGVLRYELHELSMGLARSQEAPAYDDPDLLVLSTDPDLIFLKALPSLGYSLVYALTWIPPGGGSPALPRYPLPVPALTLDDISSLPYASMVDVWAPPVPPDSFTFADPSTDLELADLELLPLGDAPPSAPPSPSASSSGLQRRAASLAAEVLAPARPFPVKDALDPDTHSPCALQQMAKLAVLEVQRTRPDLADIYAEDESRAMVMHTFNTLLAETATSHEHARYRQRFFSLIWSRQSLLHAASAVTLRAFDLSLLAAQQIAPHDCAWFKDASFDGRVPHLVRDDLSALSAPHGSDGHYIITYPFYATALEDRQVAAPNSRVITFVSSPDDPPHGLQGGYGREGMRFFRNLIWRHFEMNGDLRLAWYPATVQGAPGELQDPPGGTPLIYLANKALQAELAANEAGVANRRSPRLYSDGPDVWSQPLIVKAVFDGFAALIADNSDDTDHARQLLQRLSDVYRAASAAVAAQRVRPSYLDVRRIAAMELVPYDYYLHQGQEFPGFDRISYVFAASGAGANAPEVALYESLAQCKPYCLRSTADAFYPPLEGVSFPTVDPPTLGFRRRTTAWERAGPSVSPSDPRKGLDALTAKTFQYCVTLNREYGPMPGSSLPVSFSPTSLEALLLHSPDTDPGWSGSCEEMHARDHWTDPSLLMMGDGEPGPHGAPQEVQLISPDLASHSRSTTVYSLDVVYSTATMALIAQFARKLTGLEVDSMTVYRRVIHTHDVEACNQSLLSVMQSQHLGLEACGASIHLSFKACSHRPTGTKRTRASTAAGPSFRPIGAPVVSPPGSPPGSAPAGPEAVTPPSRGASRSPVLNLRPMTMATFRGCTVTPFSLDGSNVKSSLRKPLPVRREPSAPCIAAPSIKVPSLSVDLTTDEELPASPCSPGGSHLSSCSGRREPTPWCPVPSCPSWIRNLTQAGVVAAPTLPEAWSHHQLAPRPDSPDTRVPSPITMVSPPPSPSAEFPVTDSGPPQHRLEAMLYRGNPGPRYDARMYIAIPDDQGHPHPQEPASSVWYGRLDQRMPQLSTLLGSLLNVVERSAALSPSTETESDLSSDYSSLEFTSETSDGAAFYMSLSFEFLNHRLEGSTRDLWYEGLVRDHLAALGRSILEAMSRIVESHRHSVHGDLVLLCGPIHDSSGLDASHALNAALGHWSSERTPSAPPSPPAVPLTPDDPRAAASVELMGAGSAPPSLRPSPPPPLHSHYAYQLPRNQQPAPPLDRYRRPASPYVPIGAPTPPKVRRSSNACSDMRRLARDERFPAVCNWPSTWFATGHPAVYQVTTLAEPMLVDSLWRQQRNRQAQLSFRGKLPSDVVPSAQRNLRLNRLFAVHPGDLTRARRRPDYREFDARNARPATPPHPNAPPMPVRSPGIPSSASLKNAPRLFTCCPRCDHLQLVGNAYSFSPSWSVATATWSGRAASASAQEWHFSDLESSQNDARHRAIALHSLRSDDRHWEESHQPSPSVPLCSCSNPDPAVDLRGTRAVTAARAAQLMQAVNVSPDLLRCRVCDPPGTPLEDPASFPRPVPRFRRSYRCRTCDGFIVPDDSEFSEDMAKAEAIAGRLWQESLIDCSRAETTPSPLTLGPSAEVRFAELMHDSALLRLREDLTMAPLSTVIITLPLPTEVSASSYFTIAPVHKDAPLYSQQFPGREPGQYCCLTFTVFDPLDYYANQVARRVIARLCTVRRHAVMGSVWSKPQYAVKVVLSNNNLFQVTVPANTAIALATSLDCMGTASGPLLPHQDNPWSVEFMLTGGYYYNESALVIQTFFRSLLGCTPKQEASRRKQRRYGYCRVCFQATDLQCSNCNNEFYCSADCQRDDAEPHCLESAYSCGEYMPDGGRWATRYRDGAHRPFYTNDSTLQGLHASASAIQRHVREYLRTSRTLELRRAALREAVSALAAVILEQPPRRTRAMPTSDTPPPSTFGERVFDTPSIRNSSRTPFDIRPLLCVVARHDPSRSTRAPQKTMQSYIDGVNCNCHSPKTYCMVGGGCHALNASETIAASVLPQLALRKVAAKYEEEERVGHRGSMRWTHGLIRRADGRQDRDDCRFVCPRLTQLVQRRGIAGPAPPDTYNGEAINFRLQATPGRSLPIMDYCWVSPYDDNGNPRPPRHGSASRPDSQTAYDHAGGMYFTTSSPDSSPAASVSSEPSYDHFEHLQDMPPMLLTSDHGCASLSIPPVWLPMEYNAAHENDCTPSERILLLTAAFTRLGRASSACQVAPPLLPPPVRPPAYGDSSVCWPCRSGPSSLPPSPPPSPPAPSTTTPLDSAHPATDTVPVRRTGQSKLGGVQPASSISQPAIDPRPATAGGRQVTNRSTHAPGTPPRCIDNDCPCTSPYNGEYGEHCCLTCFRSHPCERNYHAKPFFYRPPRTSWPVPYTEPPDSGPGSPSPPTPVS